MKFAAPIGMVDPSFYVPLARAAEEAGFDQVVLPDSICYPQESDSTYPYTADGSREFLEDKVFIDPLVAAATMAAVTTQLTFRTGVLKVPIRHPVLLAKTVTSLAVITGERFVLGVGTSPWPDDYEVVGVPWTARGRRFDECLTILEGLSRGDYFEFHGEFYDFPAIKLTPVPTRPVPLIVGGHAEAQLRRAARIGDGWTPAGLPTEALAEILPRLHEMRREAGRDHLPFEVHASNADSATPDGIRRLEELGVTHTTGRIGAARAYRPGPDTEPLSEKLDVLHRYAETVIAKVS